MQIELAELAELRECSQELAKPPAAVLPKGGRMYHFLKSLKLTQELSQSFGMAVAFMMFIKELRRNGGETAASAKNCHLPPIFFVISR